MATIRDVVGRFPLVGRDDEIAGLRAVLETKRGPRGAAVFGEAGVGKTRLVAEVVDACRDDGAAVEWVRATDAAREIALGSFAHLLAPGDEAHQRDDLLHIALGRLRERARRDEFILAVDDAHLLDEVSIALLHLAATQSPVRLLLSIRTGEPVPRGLVGLWKDEQLERLDVRPLPRAATERLVLSVLGDGVPTSLLDRIWRLSRGNVLFVRELITAAVERIQQGDSRGRGRVVLPAEGSTERLHELVEERLRLLDPGQRQALEVVAVGEQVPVDAAAALAEPADFEKLERRSLIELVVAGPGAGMLQVAHPLYGEVLDATLPRLRRRSILRDLVCAAEGLDRFDRLRLAVWRLESGEPGDPEQLLPLAREALGRLDHRLAERLALAAGGTSRADAGLIVGEALSGQGRIQEAETVLAGLRPADPEQVAQVAIARASELFLHLDRSHEAFEVLRNADNELEGHPAWQADCRSVLAQMCMFSLRMAEGGEIAKALLADPVTPDPARVRAVSVAVTVLGAEGKVDEGLALLDDAIHEAARRHRREVPFGELQLRMARYQVLYWAGRVHDLDDYTAANLGLDVDHPPPSLRGIVAGFRGGALILQGRAREALEELNRSCRALEETDWFGQRPLAEAMRARAAVFAGDLAGAKAAIQAADGAFAADTLRGARTLPFIELSRAWVLAGSGAVVDAADRSMNLASAMELVSAPLAVEALHTAVRLGRASDAVEALARLADVVDGPFVNLALRHARALVNGEADGLARVADEFEALGADLLAAEVYRSAANAYRRAGRGASSLDTSRRVDELLGRCGDPYSPAMEPLVVMGEQLTGREREIALLAAGGRTSPEIAETLFLSVRTVDTHLHHVYRKLMIDGRHELARAMGVETMAGASEGRRT